jgi:hypothetical protein
MFYGTKLGAHEVNANRRSHNISNIQKQMIAARAHRNYAIVDNLNHQLMSKRNSLTLERNLATNARTQCDRLQDVSNRNQDWGRELSTSLEKLSRVLHDVKRQYGFQ